MALSIEDLWEEESGGVEETGKPGSVTSRGLESRVFLFHPSALLKTLKAFHRKHRTIPNSTHSTTNQFCGSLCVLTLPFPLKFTVCKISLVLVNLF